MLKKLRFQIFLVVLMGISFFSNAQHLFFHLLPGFGTRFTWVGLGSDANWNTPQNWSESAVPGATDVANFDGSCVTNCDPTMNVAINVLGVNIKASYAGTITQASGQSITIGSTGWTQEAGSFVGTDATISMSDPFNMSGGTFTESTNTWTHSSNFIITGGSFVRNSGTVVFNESLTINANGTHFNNVEFTGVYKSFDLSGGTIFVRGDLTLNDIHGSDSAPLNNGTIEARQNLTVLNQGKRGNAIIKMNGTLAQTLTGSVAGWVPSIEIDKTGGTLTISGTVRSYGNWSWLQGTVDTTGSTISFEETSTIIPGNIQYNHVTFTGSYETNSLSGGTMTVNGTLSLADAHGSSAGILNSGTIEAKGNVVIANQGKIGTALIKINGAGAQSLTGSAVGWIGNLEVDKATGTLTAIGTIRSYGDWTWTQGASDFTGTTLTFEASNTITPGNPDYNHVSFVGDHRIFSLNSGTMKVLGTLTMSDLNASGGGVNSGTLNASGNVIFSNYGKRGSAILNFTGTANTTLTIGASAFTLDTTNLVAKTGTGSVAITANTNYVQVGKSFTITSGTFNVAGFTFAVNSLLTISTGGKLLCNGGTATAGSWTIQGEISCGSGQGITWTGQSGDGLWSTASNWTNNTIPGASDIALFNAALCVGAQCNSQINSNLSVRGIVIQSTYTGTLTQNSTRTLTIGTGGYSQAGGTFAGGDSAITMNGAFTLSGGTFTATSGVWTQSANMTVSGAPSFFHNSGTWSTSSSITITPNNIELYNVEIAGSGSRTQSLNSGTLIVSGLLTFHGSHPSTADAVNDGTIEARGNINLTGRGKNGTAVVLINGGGAQSITGASSQIPVVQINKAAGTLDLIGTIRSNQNWSHILGTVNAGTSTVIFGETQTIIPGSIEYFNVTFTGSLRSHNLSAGTMIVNGTLTLSDGHTSTPGDIHNGTIHAKGDISITGSGKRGDADIIINGLTDQLMTGNGFYIPSVTINKPSGTLNLDGTIRTEHDWIYNAGLVNAGTSTLNFTGSLQITPGSVIYNNVIFGGSTRNFDLNSGTMIIAGTLTLADAHVSTPASVNSGTLESRGNISISGSGKTGTATIRITGTGSQLFTGVSGSNPSVEIDKPSGTLTLAGTISNSGNWTWLNGAVDAGTSTLSFRSNNTIVPGSIEYYNMTFGGGSVTQDLSGSNLILNGTLTLDGGNGSSNLNNGVVEARGNISVTSAGKYGNAQLIANGNSSTTLSWVGTSLFGSTLVTINKGGGSSVSLLTNANFSSAGRDFTIASGTLDLNGFDLNVNDVLTIGVGATLKCNGGELTTPLPVSIVNSGTINCPGYSTYDFNWTGAGGNSSWSTDANWSGGVAPTATDLVVFQDTYCGGTCNSSIDSAASVRGVRILSPFSGTISQTAGQSLTIGTRGWSQAAGTFTGGNSAINNGGNFTLSGGTFTSTSGMLTMTAGDAVPRSWTVSTGTFNHNNGDVVVAIAGSQTTTFTGGTNPYYNLNFATWAGSYTVSGTTTVNNHFQFGTAGNSSLSFTGGTINALSNVTCNGAGAASNVATTVINVSGTAAQNLTGVVGCTWPSLTINKASGTASLVGTIDIRGVLNYTAGTVDAGTSKVQLYSVTTTKTHFPNGISLYEVDLSTWGTGTHNLSSQVLNVANTLTFSATTSAGTINAGTINASGNVVHAGTTSLGGTAVLNLIGSTNTTITPNGVLTLPGATVNVNKSALNSVTLLGNTRFNNAGQNLIVTAGTLNMAGFNLTVGNNISNSGTIQRGLNPACGTISQGGSFAGNAAICP